MRLKDEEAGQLLSPPQDSATSAFAAILDEMFTNWGYFFKPDNHPDVNDLDSDFWDLSRRSARGQDPRPSPVLGYCLGTLGSLGASE